MDKVLYPSIAITKAQVIQYYLDIAPHLLKYITGRPLTVIRYPDGLNGDSFYSKDKPNWTPEWISSQVIQHEKKSINYLIADNIATVAWLANLAALELHPLQFRKDNACKPDFFVIDIDPDEELGFDSVKETAYALKQFFEDHDFTPFVKTSGGKGCHVLVPILPNTPYEEVSQGVKLLATKFISKYPNRYTLNMQKSQRKGKIFIDIYRNYLTNTTIAPYSLRGKQGAPISMPLEWSQLDNITSAKEFTISNYQSQIAKHGDPWNNWRAGEQQMYLGRENYSGADLDDRLSSYQEKRDFSKTAEPLPKTDRKHSRQFVLQLHNASSLHYDLRLEENGVLLSWAIPKGLPYKKGQKRLAIRTEDHPVKYLTFEGVIPQGQYGAGEMWIIDTGSIEWELQKENHYKFKISGHHGACNYNLYHTKENQWIIEAQANRQINSIDTPIKPMLASASRGIPKSDELIYEVKWDGIRTLLYLEDDSINLLSRVGRDITEKFPEFVDSDLFRAEHAIIDAEIVVLDAEGKPLFHEVISRMHQSSARGIQQSAINKSAVCYCFDLIALNGYDLRKYPLQKRKAWLSTILKTNSTIRLSQDFKDGELLWKAIQNKKMEGIMAKNKNGLYHDGARTEEWIKVKCRYIDKAYIIGYTQGEGRRAGAFGALHLAKKNEKLEWQYMGKVGTGYGDQLLDELYKEISQIPASKKLINDTIEEEKNTKWIAPELECKIEYASLSSNDTYREPVFQNIIRK